MNTKLIRIILLLVSLTGVLAMTAFAETGAYKGYPRGKALITVQELRQLIDAKDPRLVVLAAENSIEYSTDLLAPSQSAHIGNFTAKVTLPSLRVETPDMIAAQGSSAPQIWDNRDIKEFTGEELKKGAYRAGRIPGSNHSDWAQFKKKDNQAEWLPATEVTVLLSKLGYDRSREQYFYCQSGVRSTQALFALYLAGWPLEKLHNYDSSWIGWSKDKSLPLLTGLPTAPRLAQAGK
jgi:thiosulfate/3-mercaptopyruvate sulfurtransferase